MSSDEQWLDMELMRNVYGAAVSRPYVAIGFSHDDKMVDGPFHLLTISAHPAGQ